MNDIDFIKGCALFAKDFEIIIYDDSDIEIKPTINSDEEEIFTDIGTFMSHYAYKHFLTKTIDGINKGEAFEIVQTRSNLLVHPCGRHDVNTKYFEIIPNKEDIAKRSAIEYVLRNSP